MKTNLINLDEGKNLLNTYTCNRIELLNSIDKAMTFAVIFIITSLVEGALVMFEGYKLCSRVGFTLYLFCSMILSCIIFYLLRAKVKPKIKASSKNLINFNFYTLIIQIIGITYLIAGPFCSAYFMILNAENELLKCVSLPILFNSLYYICHLVIRNPKINIIIYAVFVLFLYSILNLTYSFNKDLIMKLAESAFMSLITSSQCANEKLQKVDKFIKRIIEKYNILYIFFKNIPDIIYIETKEKSKYPCLQIKEPRSFLNDSALKVPFCPKSFNISSEQIFDSKNCSLKQKIDILRATKIEKANKVEVCEEDYHNLNVEKRRIYKVVSLKIDTGKEESLGLYIKNISETVDLISQATSIKVSNTHICTFSHEIRNPLNQVLGILIKLKKESKNIFMKNNIGMAKAACLRLSSRFDIYLDYNKLLNQTLVIKTNPTTLSTIYKEIKRLNYEYFYRNLQKEMSIKLDPSIRNTKINLKSRPVIMIIQYIIEKLVAKNNLHHITLSAFLFNEEKYVEFVITEGVKGEKITPTNIFKKGWTKPAYNSLFSKSRFVEPVSDLMTNYIEKIKMMINAKLKSTINENDQERHSISVEFTKPGIEENDDFSEEDFTEFEIGGREVFPNYKQMMDTILKVKPHLFPLEKGRRTTIEDESKCIERPITLVVDDERMNRYAICGMLKSFDVQIVEAEDGQVCLSKYNSMSDKEKDRLIIFMDLSMPNMDGISCCEVIRKIESKLFLQKVPIIAITGHDSEIERRKAKEAGMTDFFPKPIQKNTLKELLAKHFLFK